MLLLFEISTMAEKLVTFDSSQCLLLLLRLRLPWRFVHFARKTTKWRINLTAARLWSNNYYGELFELKRLDDFTLFLFLLDARLLNDFINICDWNFLAFIQIRVKFMQWNLIWLKWSELVIFYINYNTNCSWVKCFLNWLADPVLFLAF